MTELPLNYGQVLSGGRVLVGDEGSGKSLLKFKGSQRHGDLTASIWGSRMELQPANATIRLDQTKAEEFPFLDGTDLRISRGLLSKGWRGASLCSAELRDRGRANHFLDRLSSVDGVSDGNLSFAIQKGGTGLDKPTLRLEEPYRLIPAR